MIWTVIVLCVLAAGLAALMWTTSLPRSFEARKAEAMTEPSHQQARVLTDADMVHLPPPVRRYIRLSGSIGRPVVTEITMHFDATMFAAPGAPGMTGPVVQYERFDTLERLFLMKTRMKGLPVAVLHDFNRDHARMKVRLAGLFNVVNIDGPDLTRTETVTILNELCFYAPSRLIDPRLTWTEMDDTHARVTFTNDTNTVSAELVFNAAGELVNFVSDDRGMLEKDGSLRILRRTTPRGDYRTFDGWCVASEGNAIWNLPERPFTYCHLRLTHYATW